MLQKPSFVPTILKLNTNVSVAGIICWYRWSYCSYVEELSSAEVVTTGMRLGMGLCFFLLVNQSLLFLPSVWATIQTLHGKNQNLKRFRSSKLVEKTVCSDSSPTCAKFWVIFNGHTEKREESPQRGAGKTTSKSSLPPFNKWVQLLNRTVATF